MNWDVQVYVTALPSKLNFGADRIANITEETGLRIDVLPEYTLKEWDWVSNWAEKDLDW